MFQSFHWRFTAHSYRRPDATDQWYTNMDNGLINGIMFIDLKKAFDTIDHNILLKQLS
jgi:hypothetical protein